MESDFEVGYDAAVRDCQNGTSSERIASRSDGWQRGYDAGMASEDARPKRGPGRPLTPGNAPGSDGCPQIRFRVSPEDYKRIQEAGGSSWVRDTVLAILDIRRDEGESSFSASCRSGGIEGPSCASCRKIRPLAKWEGDKEILYYCAGCFPL